ncbi:MAG: PCRF domain-containing protein, partial [Clostridiales bacterium]|nr:PCRF domain-containing protein [Clostridiales bacterium]
MEEVSADPKFWEDPENSQKLLQQIKQLRNKVTVFEKLSSQYDDVVTLAELGIEEQDASVISEAQALSETFKAAYEKLRIETLLSGEYD